MGGPFLTSRGKTIAESKGDEGMAALVETMFSVREKPWHGLGTIVKEAPTSADAIRLAGLDWTVVQEPIYTNFSKPVDGYRANVRSTDRKMLPMMMISGFRISTSMASPLPSCSPQRR